MRILMITPVPLKPTLGAAKVLIELSEALRARGCICDLAGPDEVGMTRTLDESGWRRFAHAQAEFIQRHANGYEVIDYDHESLPFSRSSFPAGRLMVARSVLLALYLQIITPPVPCTFRSFAAQLLRAGARSRFRSLRVEFATRTIEGADLVNVSNEYDRGELVRRGVPESKIAVLPFGSSRRRRAEFERICSLDAPRAAVVAFVGTFDWRKGAADFPAIVSQVRSVLPGTRFRLLGARGLFRSTTQVLAVFPRRLRAAIEVVPEFDPDDLPKLLADCAVGVFPSYYEGFGFGVLEMLAAALPVAAYDAPGPAMMLPSQWLCAPGDSAGISRKLCQWLCDPRQLAEARREARMRSGKFDWQDIAEQTIATYSDALDRLRGRVP